MIGERMMTDMRRVRTIVVAMLLAGVSQRAAAQLASVRVSGSPAKLEVTGAVAGSQPNADFDNSTTYTVANLFGNKKVTAQLNAAMPNGVTLMATFAAPSGATSIPNVVLDATARDVVTGIGFTLGTARSITYTLSATPAAGVVPAQSRSVTLTIVSAP
jgi:hypothetical protein